MRRLLTAALLAGAFVGLCACANHTFAPGPGMTAGDLQPDAARCRISARSSDPSLSFEASGSSKSVAIAMVSAAVIGAIGTAVQENASYNDCMMALGWQVADGPAPAGATTLPVQSAAPAAAATLPTQSAAPAATTTLAVLGDTSSRVPDPPRAGRRNLGIRAANVTDSRAYSAQLDPPRGLVVMAVMQGGAASAAGLQTGDVILSFGAAPLMTVADLQHALTTTAANSVVPAKIWRDRQEIAANFQF